MKNVMKRSFAVLMTLVMCASMFFGLTFSAQAAETPTVNYVYDGSYIYNWGTREEDATFLSPKAIEFYSDNNTSYDALSALSGNSTESSVPSSTLYQALYTLMEKNHTTKTSYDGTKKLYRYTDCEESNTSTMSSFYSGTQLTSEWDSTNTWNREHTWPNSKSNSGDSYTSRETDIIMLRPATPSNNSSRGNKAYGTETTTTYFNPNNFANDKYDVRGDAARAILYVYVRWGGGINADGALDYMWGSSGVIESKEVLLQWMEEDPVDTWEMGRNDATESITGTRNVFIDYPELAFLLFDAEVPNDDEYTSPSDGISVESDNSSSGDNTDNESGDTTTDTNVVSTATYVFSEYPAGKQYAEESHDLDGIVNVSTYGRCHFTTQLRIYGATSSASNGYAIITSQKKMRSIVINAGYKESNIYISSSTDGVTWTSPETVAITSTSYLDYTFDNLPDGTKYFKIETTDQQLRIAKMTITFVSESADDSGNDITDKEIGFLKDETNGVFVEGYQSAFPEDTVVIAEKLESGDNFEKATTALNGIASQFNVYDFTAKSSDTTVQLNQGKTVTLTFDIPGFDPDRVGIVYISDEGEVEILDSAVDKTANTVSATLTHFSLYAVIETAETETETDSGTTTYSKIDTVENLSAGTYKMAGVVDETYHYFTGTISSGDLNTSASTFVDGVISAADAVDITLTATAENTYTILVDGKYINPSSNSALTTGDTAYEWEASNYAKGGILLTTTINDSATYMGTNKQASTKLIRNYSATSSISYGVVFFKAGETIDGGEETSHTVTADSNNTNYGTVSKDDNNVITATPNPGYKVSGYTVTPNDAATVTPNDDNTFTVTDVKGDVTVTINFALENNTVDGYYVKVGTELADWSGEYLIVYEDDGIAFNGGLETLDIGHNVVSISEYITSGKIERNSATKAVRFTIAQVDGGYTIKSESGYYIGRNAKSNGLNASDSTAYVNTVSFDENVKITGLDNTVLQFYSSTGINDYRFRYYTTSQQPIALYKYVENFDAEYTITANPNDESMGGVDVIGNLIYATPATGYVVSGYAVTSGSATVAQNGNTFTVSATSDAEITINFAPRDNKVTFVENGKVISTITAKTGETITLPTTIGSINADKFEGWVLKDSTEIITEYKVNADVIFYAQYKTTESGGTDGGESVEVTLSFADKANRTSFSTTQQIWQQNGISFTNDKENSSTNVADYSNPVRLYANSSITIAYPGMTKIAITANSASYATALKNSIDTTTYNVTISGSVVTIEFNSAANEFTVEKLTAQTRFNSITVTATTSGPAEPTGEIKGAQVEVGTDLSLNYYVSLQNISDTDSVVMRFTLPEYPDEAAVEVSLDKDAFDGKYYVFKYDKIAPQCMTDIIKAELVINDEVMNSVDEYSIQENAKNLLKAYSGDKELMRFISDMLYYGAASQTYRDYKADAEKLATYGVDGLLENLEKEPTDADNKMLLDTEENVTIGEVFFKSASVWFDVTNSLIIRVNNAPTNANLYLVCADGKETPLEYDAEIKGYKIDGIKATDFDTVYTFVLYENGVKIQTLNYSINTYTHSINKNSTDQIMKDLALALYNYGLSAEEYANR